MAENRKSATQAAARKAARERAAERAADFRRRQEHLEELAAEYFVAVDAVESIEVAAEERIAAIRAETAKKIEASRAEASAIVGRMLDTKVTRDEVAERLGIPVREVRRAQKTVPPIAGDTQTADPERHGSLQHDRDEAFAA